MKENNSRREFLSQSGKMVTAAALFGTSVPLAHAAVAGTLNCEANNTMKITDPHYYLDNVLLETGFDYENGVAVQAGLGLTVRTRIGMPGNLRPAGGLLPSPGSLAVSLQQTPRQEPHSAAVALLGKLMTEALQEWVER